MRETFTLPAPISVNRLKTVSNGRIVASPAYRRWRIEAAEMLGYEQRAAKRAVTPPYAVSYLVPRASGMDLDNAFKAASDALEAAGVMTNDARVEHIDGGFHDGPFTVTVSHLVIPENGVAVVPCRGKVA